MRKYTPFRITWNITGQRECNLNCIHCYADDNSYKEKSISLEDNLKILSSLKQIGIKVIAFSGGEPLLYPYLKELISATNAKGIKSEILTNGILIDKEWLSFFKNNNVDFIQVSIDGPEEIHDKIRGVKGSFKKSIEAIKLSKAFGFTVCANTTLTTLNYSKLSEIKEIIESIDIRWGVEHFTPTGRGKDNSYLCLDKFENKKALMDLKLYSENINIKAADPLKVLLDESYSAFCNIFNEFGYPTGCSIGVIGFSIAPNGDIFPCPRLPYKIGNIRKDDFYNLWDNDPLLCNFRNRKGLSGKCGKCNYKFRCGGCRALAFAVNGDIYSEDPNCWICI